MNNRKGLTLVEGLVATLLLAVTLTTVIGTFTIARVSTPAARHRQLAMNILRTYIENEVYSGYGGGGYTAAITGTPIIEVNDNVRYSVTPNPWPAAAGVVGTNGFYKTVGFVVTWSEFAGGAAVVRNEKAAVHIASH